MLQTLAGGPRSSRHRHRPTYPGDDGVGRKRVWGRLRRQRLGITASTTPPARPYEAIVRQRDLIGGSFRNGRTVNRLVKSSDVVRSCRSDGRYSPSSRPACPVRRPDRRRSTVGGGRRPRPWPTRSSGAPSLPGRRTPGRSPGSPRSPASRPEARRWPGPRCRTCPASSGALTMSPRPSVADGEPGPGGGGEAVDPHPVAPELLGRDDREGGDPGLGRPVVGLAGVAEQTRGRRRVDHRGARDRLPDLACSRQ